MNNRVTDPDLWRARYAIRTAYIQVRQLPQTDPIVRELVTRLDAMCVEISAQIDAIQPEMELVG